MELSLDGFCWIIRAGGFGGITDRAIDMGIWFIDDCFVPRRIDYRESSCHTLTLGLPNPL